MLVTDHALDQEAWIQPDEGQLSVDVIETYESVIIRAAIAGVSVEDVDIYIAEDVVTVRGNRHLDQKEEVGSTYHFRECYWGGFSRTIVLPAHVRPRRRRRADEKWRLDHHLAQGGG